MEMRQVLAAELERLMSENENIVVIDSDLSKPNGLSRLKNKFPDRSIDIESQNKTWPAWQRG